MDEDERINGTGAIKFIKVSHGFPLSCHFNDPVRNCNRKALFPTARMSPVLTRRRRSTRSTHAKRMRWVRMLAIPTLNFNFFHLVHSQEVLNSGQAILVICEKFVRRLLRWGRSFAHVTWPGSPTLFRISEMERYRLVSLFVIIGSDLVTFQTWPAIFTRMRRLKISIFWDLLSTAKNQRRSWLKNSRTNSLYAEAFCVPVYCCLWT